MRVAFRADASLQIGTGHVMRCLTLADALTAKGAVCQFLCRAHEGNLITFIRSKGYVTHVLPPDEEVDADATAIGSDAPSSRRAKCDWLGTTQEQDAEACGPILAAQNPDWLIVDHYALDAKWESALASKYARLMVIDDLADRRHICDLLLDQTAGREEADYHPLVPGDCRLLCGSKYALLRPEFAAVRARSLLRRADPAMHELLITMGGVDNENVTEQVLKALRTCQLPPHCRITVVMGPTAPWLSEIGEQAQDMPWPTRVLTGVSHMAQLMADSDLAIGAAGATSWERCCVGLPSIVLVLAENQRRIAHELCRAGAARMFAVAELKHQPLITRRDMEPRSLAAMSASAAAITDGSGTARVIAALTCRPRHAH